MKRILLFLALAVSCLSAHGASFPYITFSGNTNRLAYSNGSLTWPTNATLAGVASAGAFSLNGVAIDEWQWTTNFMDSVVGDYFGVTEIRPADALNSGNTLMVSTPQGILFESPQFTSPDRDGEPWLWGTNTYAVFLPSSNDPTDATRGGLILYGLGVSEQANEESPITLLALWAGITNRPTTWPAVYIGAQLPTLSGPESDTGMILGVGNDGSPLNILTVTAEHAYLPAGYGRIGVNTNEPPTTLGVRSYEPGIDHQQWVDSTGALAASITSNGVAYASSGFISGAPSGGTAAAWKFGTNHAAYVEAEVSGTPVSLVSLNNGSVTATKAFQSYQGTLTHAGTVMLDFDASTTVNSLSATGALTLATSNLATNRTYRLRITGTTTNSALSAPSWKWQGYVPTQITANKVSELELIAWGSTDTSVDAWFTEQP